MEVSGLLHALAASSPGKDPQYPLTEGCVGFRADLDAVVRKKSLP